MIRPAITPRRITGNATTGIVTAARGGVRNIQRSTNTISKAPDVTKEQRFGMNYVQFFGSKKTFKVLEKSMKTIRDSMVSTFAMAKELKDSVTKGEGVFGFVGKIIGLAAGAIGLFSILGAPIIKTLLASIALGGIGSVLFAFKDQIIDFFKDKASGFSLVVKEIIDDFLVDRFQSGEFKDLLGDSEDRMEKIVEELTSREKNPLNIQDATVQATEIEIATLKDQLTTLRKKRGKKPTDKRTIDAIKSRIKFLETGEMSLPKRPNLLGIPLTGIKVPEFVPGLGGRSFADLDPANVFRSQVEKRLGTEGVYTGNPDKYLSLSPEEKAKRIQASLLQFSRQNDISQAKITYQRDLKIKNLTDGDKQQARDIIKYIDAVGGNALGGIEGEDKDKFLKQLSPLTQGKKLSKNVTPNGVTGGTITGGGGGGGTEVAMLPMNNQKNDTLARNDTGGLSNGPSMTIFENFDHDNFKALFNQADLNIV